MEERYTLKKPDTIKTRKRVGRGHASGSGKTCGRGQDGQRSRSGSTRRPWFEGGQMPLQRRIPKRGFNNYTKKIYQIVNVSSLNLADAPEMNPEDMKGRGIIKHSDRLVKVLGYGDIDKAVTVVADAFSESAIEKIKKAGGSVIIRKFPVTKESKVDNV